MGPASRSDGPLRVLLTVHHDLEPGTGAAGSTLSLAAALERRGHRVEVVGLDLVGRRTRGALDAARFPHAIARLVRRRLERGDVDVVDASSGDVAWVGAARIRAGSTAVLTRSHGLEHLADTARRAGAASGELDLRRRYAVYHGGLRLFEVARSFRSADGALLLNAAEVDFATSALGIPSERTWRTAPLIDAGLGVLERAEERDLLVLGPASWRKGGDVASRVIESVLRVNPSATATWSGLEDPAITAGELAGDVRSRVRTAGRYSPAGLAGLLASHRVLVFASRFEGLPVTLLEALRSGISVLGSDIPGVSDLLCDGAGVLVPAGHVEGFVTSALRLLGDAPGRARCAAAGHAAAARYEPDEVVDQLEAAYRTVLSVKRPSG